MKEMKRKKAPLFIIISILTYMIFCAGLLYKLIPDLQLQTIGVITGFSGLFLTVVLLASLIRQKRSFNILMEGMSKINHSEQIDLTRLMERQRSQTTNDFAEKINGLTSRLNSIFIDVTQSTRKFNLFASDIFFSARHLSEQSINQSHTMEEILGQVLNFQEALSSLEYDISQILSQLNETSHSYEKLSSLSEEAAERLKPLAQNTHEAYGEANEGLETIKNSSEAINNLVDIMGNLQTRMEDMSEQTSRVSKVILNLDDIADRTHVLATNASIEAARAGKEGKSFAVIASEVRKLSAHSRAAIQDVGSFLNEMSKGINENNLFWNIGVEKVNDVKGFGDQAKGVLRSISSRMGELSTSMNAFQKIFEDQDVTIKETLEVSASVTSKINGFTETLKEQSIGNKNIQERVNSASEGAASASRSASVLSQLATYLKVGGKELQYAVKFFLISKKRLLSEVVRQEIRRGLIYNLEVFHRDRFIGNLGDLSPSGLLLYSDEDFELNKEFTATILLPIGFSQLEKIDILFTPRRSEKDGKTFRIGCSMRLKETYQKAEFEEIIEKLSIHDDEDFEFQPTHEMDEDIADDGLEELVLEEL